MWIGGNGSEISQMGHIGQSRQMGHIGQSRQIGQMVQIGQNSQMTNIHVTVNFRSCTPNIFFDHSIPFSIPGVPGCRMRICS